MESSSDKEPGPPLLIDDEINEEKARVAGEQPAYVPPPRPERSERNAHIKMVIILTGAIAVAVALLVIIAVFNPFGSPVIGTWHITKMKISIGHLSYTNDTSIYYVFNPNGTGSTYEKKEGKHVYFHWKDVGNDTIQINYDNSSESNTIHYQINGNHIVLTYISGLGEITLYGVRA